MGAEDFLNRIVEALGITIDRFLKKVLLKGKIKPYKK